jgi:hypothetical protein
MNYGSMIREAWSTTWHHRFLWILGLFTGASIGSGIGFGNQGSLQHQASSRDFDQSIAQLENVAANAEQWVVNHSQFVGVAAFVLVAVGLALLIVSFIAQGGMTEATIDLARHQPTSLDRAWRMGRQFFWRFVGLALAPVILAIVLASLVGIVVALVTISTSPLAAGAATAGVIALSVVIGLAAVMLFIPVAVALSIVLAYAQRAVVSENVGPIAAVQAGWRILRSHVGESLLVWLINLGLTILANLAILIATFLVAGTLAGIGFILWNVAGFATITVIYAGFGIVATIAVFWGLEAIANVFLWDFWTIAYLRLTGATAQSG